MPAANPNDRPPARFTRFNPENSGRHSAGTLGPGESPPPPPSATRTQSVLEYLLFAVFGGLILLAGFALYTSSSKKNRIVPNYVDQGLREDRLNILFIGIGGENHPSHDDLADSIILMSLKPSDKQVAVTSIPRDLWVPVPAHGSHRINYAHAIGDQSGYPGEGPGLLSTTVSQVFAQPVHAFVRVDFSAFEKIIDQVGGIDVDCQRGFYDFLFKDGFPRGHLHLNGKRALAYARYRYILGPEGDNFARELRQQQVIKALQEKLKQRSVQDVVGLVQAMSTLSSATETNLTTSQMISLYRAFHDVPESQIRHVSLKPFTENFTVTRLAEAGDAIRTKTGDFREIRLLERSIFSTEQQVTTEDQIRFKK